ncbi:MAG TPA: TonB-dependent receptor [Candidatus Bathyarchaeia archaeon]|jgi:hypothetical protein|nr:TonB-dependent receptor [Candidatus Bathyarchaeia archaeon]
MRLRTFAILAVALLFLASGGAVWSQTVQGVITGTVTDPTGAVVPGATVTITNVGTNVSQSTTTGSDGSYRFPLVPPGTYTVEIKAANFATVRISGIVVEASQTVPLNRQLELAKAQQVIEVTEQVPLVQTATSDLATQIDRETILNAAIADRDVFSSLPYAAPSVAPGLNMSPTSGGARMAGTAYLLNGAEDNNDFDAGGVNIRPPLESVQDFSVKTNQMTAEYGRGMGAVVSANQVSGGNKFHGSLYEFNRNASLNANDFFYDKKFHEDQALPATLQAHLPSRPKYIRNQFGGEVDGPIKKDKTFFSFAYDRIKLIADVTTANTLVPTSAGLKYVTDHAVGDGSGRASIGQQILSAYPPVTSDAPCPVDVDPNGVAGAGTNYWGNGLPNPVGCLSFSDPQSDTEDAYYGRVDHNFSSKDRLSGVVNIYRQLFVDEFGGGPLTTKGPINGTTNNHFHNISLNETHIFSPGLVNEATVTHNRHFNVFVAGDGVNKIPSISVDNQFGGCLGFSLGGPFEGGQIQGFTQDRWAITDSLTWTKGRHAIKFGGGTQAGILYRNWDLGVPGFYEFGELTRIEDGTPVSASCALGAVVTPACDQTLQTNGTVANVGDESNANFTGDYPYFQETSVDPATGAKANAYRHYTYHDWYWFAQDDWKITPRLTLNLGMRWDRYGAPSEAHNILAQFTNFNSCNLSSAACVASVRIGPVSRMWPTRNHDYAPRVGFAWDPMGKGKMAVRGGFGIYYDRIFDNVWSNGAWNPPFYGLADFENDIGDATFYDIPATLGAAYNPSLPGCQIPNLANANCIGHRVSVRTMDVNMHDSSGMNYYLGVERQVFGGLLFRVNYQGSMGRHLPMLEYLNRVDGIGYYANMVQLAQDPTATPVPRLNLSPVRPNALYTGFNYRSNSVSSNYNSLIAEVQKHMGHGLEFQTSYTYSKLLDVNSELFSGCYTSGSFSAPYYYISASNPRLNYGRGAFDHRHAYKFNVTYELPFLKSQKGFTGHALGGWSLGSLMQLYSGHPVDVFVGPNIFGTCTNRIAAKDAGGNLVLDQNGVPFNLGRDYNLDRVCNEHPDYVGSSIAAAYSGGSPADGIFKDNNRIGCGEAGLPANVANVSSCNNSIAGGAPSTLFVNPAYPTGATPYLRFGGLGRGVFQGPRFVQLDLALSKSFKLAERAKLDFRAQAQNLANHPDFDCIQGNVTLTTFGKAQCLAQALQGLGSPASRIMSLGLRLSF